jgi:hypothetical protein
MRLLFLGEAVSPHIVRWQQEFDRLGWDTLVASCDFGSSFTGRKLESPVGKGPLRYLSLTEQIKELVAEFSPHLVNAHYLPTYGLAAAFAKLHPLILTLWGSDILISGKRGLFSRMRSRFVLSRSDLVVGDSKYLLTKAAEIHPLPRELAVAFGVKKSWFESGAARVLTDRDQLKIISTRRLEPLYDISTLIRAGGILKD